MERDHEKSEARSVFNFNEYNLKDLTAQTIVDCDRRERASLMAIDRFGSVLCVSIVDGKSTGI